MANIDIKQGDCYKLIKSLPDNSIDLIITDPPYLLVPKGGGSFMKTRKYVDEIEPMKNGVDTNMLDQMCRVMKKITFIFFAQECKSLYFIIISLINKIVIGIY